MRWRRAILTTLLAGSLAAVTACSDNGSSNGTAASATGASSVAAVAGATSTAVTGSTTTAGSTTGATPAAATTTTAAGAVATTTADPAATTEVDITDPTEPPTEPPTTRLTTTTLEAPTGEVPAEAPTTTAAPVVPVGTDPACIAGSWTMATSALQALTPKVMPIPDVHLLTGSLRLDATADGRYTYSGSDLLVRVDNAGGYLEGSGSFAQTGRWSAAGATATLTKETATGGLTTWFAVSGDQRAAIPRSPAPLSFDLPARATFACDATLLAFTVTGTDGTAVPMIFTRG